MSKAMLRAFIYGVVILAAPFFMSGVAVAKEVIQQFDVIADVKVDGTVDIQETITVIAEGIQINHGIFRDIPTEYTDTNGRPFHMPFTIKAIQRDGKKEPYHVAGLSNGQRIYIGDKSTDVPRGQHTYIIQYQIARVIGFFPAGDEFYWNVTGNGWDFPIYKASITVTFPDGAKVTRTAAYTGPQGSTLAYYKGRTYGNHFSAETTMALGVHEGFTIAVSVPVGTIQRETTWQQVKYFFSENSMWLIWLSFAFMAVAYLFQAWMYHGRDIMGVVVPQFDAPPNIEPDLLRYVYNQQYDMKTFTTLIVNAASCNQIKIEESEKTTTLTLSKNPRRQVTYMPILMGAFLGMRSLVLPKRRFFSSKVDPEIGQALWSARIAHQTHIEEDSKPYIDKNTSYLVYGCFIGILGAIWAFFLTINEDQKFFLIFASVIFYTLVLKLFGKIMPQYTPQGQDIVEHAAGLKMYIKTAEQERMNTLYPKDITPETFEKLLPYAIALDVEQEWCDYIDALVRDGTLPPQSQWSGSRGYGYGHYGSSINSSLSSLASAISSSTTAPGRSSGFGGGGGSGGGGGGGGGGGW